MVSPKHGTGTSDKFSECGQRLKPNHSYGCSCEEQVDNANKLPESRLFRVGAYNALKFLINKHCVVL